MKKEINLKTWLVPRLRRLSYQWPARNEAKKLARVSRGVYKCNICQELFKPDETTMDHINPVVPVTGVDDSLPLYEIIGKYVVSLLVYESGWQCLCKPCHEKKTREENEIRVKNKALDSE